MTIILISNCIVSVGKDWMRGAILNWETGEIDLRILETLQARFNQIKDEIGKYLYLFCTYDKIH